MPFELHDAVTLGDTRVTRAGYLVADARVARVGIQTYLGREVGRPDLDRVRLYRGEDEVFAADALTSFGHVPVTDDHPPEMVNSENWKRFARGQAGGEVMRDGQFIRIPLMLSDAATIAAVQNGKRELSAGYVCDVDWTAGVTAEGEAYDARMTGIRGNHIAVVQRGRAGSECRIGDDDPDNIETKDQRMPILMIDGKPVETPDAAIAHIAKLESALAGATTKLTAKDGEVDALKATHAAEVTDLKAKVLDTAGIEAAVAARAALLDSARKVLGAKFDFSGKSDADVRRSAVALKLGDAKVKDRDDAYIAAAFDVVTASATTGRDPIADALVTNAPVGDAVSAYDEYVAGLRDAHLTPVKKEG